MKSRVGNSGSYESVKTVVTEWRINIKGHVCTWDAPDAGRLNNRRVSGDKCPNICLFYIYLCVCYKKLNRLLSIKAHMHKLKTDHAADGLNKGWSFFASLVSGFCRISFPSYFLRTSLSDTVHWLQIAFRLFPAVFVLQLYNFVFFSSCPLRTHCTQHWNVTRFWLWPLVRCLFSAWMTHVHVSGLEKKPSEHS